MMNDNGLRLPSGVPTLADRDRVVRSDLFADLERAAAGFLETHRDLLSDYRRRWVRDPFRQWSRHWEYPFAWTRIADHLAAREGRPTRILDAGSGVTFLPYLLAARNRHVEVLCVDSDPRLMRAHTQLAARTGLPVRFETGDLGDLGAASESFHAAYCLSVLEHSRNPSRIVEELARVLVPGGLAVLSFDISLDGDSELAAERLPSLVERVHERFSTTDLPAADRLLAQASGADALTTTAAAGIDRTLLPWPHPLVCVLRSLRRGRLPRRLGFTRLAVACAAAVK